MSAKQIKRGKKRAERTLIVDQWIEIEIVNGVTLTTRYPADEEVKKLIAGKQEATGREVELVYRRLNFVDGVPREYDWTTDDPVKRQYGGHAIQRLRVADWLEIVQYELGGHLTAGAFHMPRPDSRGACECSACRQFARRIELQGR